MKPQDCVTEAHACALEANGSTLWMRDRADEARHRGHMQYPSTLARPCAEQSTHIAPFVPHAWSDKPCVHELPEQHPVLQPVHAAR